MNDRPTVSFKKLTPLEEALNRLYAKVTPVPMGEKKVSLKDTYGKVLAEHVVSDINVPQFNRATMDGWAVKASSVEDASETHPVRLKVIGKAQIGQETRIKVDTNETVEIGTGAMLPPGANAVVMLEYSEKRGQIVRIFRSVAPGENVQERGSDIAMGEVLLRKGTVLTPKAIAAIAAIGRTKVKVYPKPKVGIVSIGNELAEPGTPLAFGEIYDINTYSLISSVKASGGTPRVHTKVNDTRNLVKKSLHNAANQVDLILSSGATSVGGGDFLPDVIETLEDSEILVHELKVKPGKPTIVGLIKGKPYFGLPGHPVSCLTMFRELVEPVLSKMAGLPKSTPPEVDAHLTSRISAPAGRKYFASVSLNRMDGELIATPTPGGSGTISNLLKADAYLLLPADREFQPKNSQIRVRLLSPEVTIPDITIAAKPSSTVNLLHQQINTTFPEMVVRAINVGNVRSILGVKRGEFTIGGISLFDAATQVFNIPHLQRFDPERELECIAGVCKTVGIAFDKRNIQLKNLKDLLDKNVTFLNRDPKSGARAILDREMQKLAEELGETSTQISTKIKGYDETSSLNVSTALAVVKGRVQAALSTKYLAGRYDLGFLPIGEVDLDFILRKDHPKAARAFLETIRSAKFKDLVHSVSGVTPKESMGKVITTRVH